jgi:4-methyl-5(b-hydroxyethyl)-thiazole monophosphate biosynthesis
MAKRVCVFLADGFEEIEAIAVVDVLRRAGAEVSLAAVGPSPEVWRTGSHDIAVRTTVPVAEVRVEQFDALVLPGGQPGSSTLRDDVTVQRLVREGAAQQLLIAAICAAPIALERAGLLTGRSATAFPGVELPSARRSAGDVVEDGNIVTSRGPGTALPFALALVRRLFSAAAADELAAKMVVASSA